MTSEIGLERRNEPIRPRRLYGMPILRLRCRDLYPPLSAMTDKSVIQDQPGEIAQARLTRCQYPDDEAVTVKDRSVKDRATAPCLRALCTLNQLETQIEQHIYRN